MVYYDEMLPQDMVGIAELLESRFPCVFRQYNTETIVDGDNNGAQCSPSDIIGMEHPRSSVSSEKDVEEHWDDPFDETSYWEECMRATPLERGRFEDTAPSVDCD